MVRNRDGRLAQVRTSVEAAHFAAAERRVHDLVAPSLSLLSFQADAAVEVSGALLTEQATQIRRYGATMIGAFKEAPATVGRLSVELRPSRASYRDGLNASSPLHQALSFYRILEHATALTTQRRRASRRGGTPADDPMARHVPVDIDDLPDQLEFERMVFPPYLGRSYADVQREVLETIRNAVTHLTPGRDVRSADLLEDIRACRDVVPVLRYIARNLITEELGRS